MKKLNVYEINDGIDGVILAKSLKQAMKKLAPYCGDSVSEILNSIKQREKDEYDFYDWSLTGAYKVIKRGNNKKVKILGWCE